MGISLNEETERLIEERMRQGGFASADELIQTILGRSNGAHTGGLDEATLDAIDEAEAQIERGEYRSLEEVAREWKERLGR